MKTTHNNILGLTLLSLAALAAPAVHAATINKTFCVRSTSKTLSGQSVTFWGYSDCGGGGGMMGGGGMGGMSSATVPGPLIEIGTGDTLNLTLNVGMMTPQEPSPYNGHTIHLHGADVISAEDGTPETNGNKVNGDTYTWSPLAGEEGSYPYHCHVHTVKHLEMGMYGAVIVRPRDASGNFMNRITADAATAYDYNQVYVLSTVDPAYHTATMNSTVFGDYNPAYFLIGGKEGKTTSSPAMTLAAAKSKKVAFRLIGMHSVNATFAIKDGSGNAKPFTVYVEDGRALPTPRTTTSVDLSPGQRADLIVTLPSTTGTWYPQVAYKKLRDNAAYATVYGKVTF
jgi:FtsP/CotA-like multicopper oxidase with cupredoxin domain